MAKPTQSVHGLVAMAITNPVPTVISDGLDVGYSERWLRNAADWITGPVPAQLPCSVPAYSGIAPAWTRTQHSTLTKPMKRHIIYALLSTETPDIAFSVSRQLDPSFRWDGDGPDPEDDGYRAYDVEVAATVIVNGAFVEGIACLGGSYFQSGEPNGNIHGYLLQMMDDALAELIANLSTNGENICFSSANVKQAQAKYAKTIVQKQMRREYDEQMTKA